MQPQPTLARLAPTTAGVLVVDGWGVRIHVNHNRLVIADGTGRTRRVGQFDRATSRLRRLVLLGHTGSITLDSMRWLSDVGVGFTVIDPDGQLLVASAGMGRDDPRLRRAQALAIDTPAGDDVARRLLAQKVAGQATTLAAHADQVVLTDLIVEALQRASAQLHLASNRDELRLAEAQAAMAYWAAWADVSVRFTEHDASRVPAHWRTFGARRSPLTGNPRLAATPACAILNYLYAVLEAEARLACLEVGLDPGLGVLHGDLKARDSLALDVMEVVRPQVDAFVLDLLAGQVLRAADFNETRQGACRVLEPLSHRLAETGPQWARAVGPVVEEVARFLVADTGSGRSAQPTPLTGAHRSAGRPRLGTIGPMRARPTRRLTVSLMVCERCGTSVPKGLGKTCEACRPGRRATTQAAFVAAGNARLTELRARGLKPGIGGPAARLRGAKVAEALHANELWERDHPEPIDPAQFKKVVLPMLRSVSTGELATTTGLSRAYAAAILNGKRVPHPRWWARLETLSTKGARANGGTSDARGEPGNGKRR